MRACACMNVWPAAWCLVGLFRVVCAFMCGVCSLSSDSELVWLCGKLLLFVVVVVVCALCDFPFLGERPCCALMQHGITLILFFVPEIACDFS